MNTIAHLIETLSTRLLDQNLMLATAESCTGGLIAAACTEVAGSSHWFERGFVTYSNAAKMQDLGVAAALLDAHGAVSEEVARAMAHGAAIRAGVQVAVSVTGIAGPDGGSAAKPVGTVCFGWWVRGQCTSQQQHFHAPDWSAAQVRSAVRSRSVEHALRGLLMRV